MQVAGRHTGRTHVRQAMCTQAVAFLVFGWAASCFYALNRGACITVVFAGGLAELLSRTAAGVRDSSSDV